MHIHLQASSHAAETETSETEMRTWTGKEKGTEYGKGTRKEAETKRQEHTKTGTDQLKSRTHRWRQRRRQEQGASHLARPHCLACIQLIIAQVSCMPPALMSRHQRFWVLGVEV